MTTEYHGLANLIHKIHHHGNGTPMRCPGAQACTLDGGSSVAAGNSEHGHPGPALGQVPWEKLASVPGMGKDGELTPSVSPLALLSQRLCKPQSFCEGSLQLPLRVSSALKREERFFSYFYTQRPRKAWILNSPLNHEQPEDEAGICLAIRNKVMALYPMAIFTIPHC